MENSISYIAILLGTLSGSKYSYGNSNVALRSLIASEILRSEDWKREMAPSTASPDNKLWE